MEAPCLLEKWYSLTKCLWQANRFAELWIMQYIALFNMGHVFLHHASRILKIVLNYGAQNILLLIDIYTAKKIVVMVILRQPQCLTSDS
jgi:hydroxypyruvate isomerase